MSAVTARRPLLAKAHIAKSQLGLDDDTWRDLVERLTGHRSSGKATDAQLVALIEELKRLGFSDQPKAKPGGVGFRPSSSPQARKIWAMWNELGRMGALDSPTRGACRAFCAKMAETGMAMIDPDFLDSAQANKVIEALKDWIARVERKVRAERKAPGAA